MSRSQFKLGEASFDQLFAVVDATPDGRAALELARRLAQQRKVNVRVIRITGANEPVEREFSSTRVPRQPFLPIATTIFAG
jgi:hypothetical protein